MNYKAINDYIEKLPNNESYMNLLEDNKIKNVFAAYELLKDNFKKETITDRAVALQVLYTLEGEEEEYSKLKRHGVTSYSVKGVSVSFEGTDIAPAVIQLLEPKPKAKVGRLI